MKCATFNATISTDACINRQLKAQELNETDQKLSSFKHCLNCKQGIEVYQNPKRFINRDFYTILKDQLKIFKERGFKRAFDTLTTYSPRWGM